jgi:hypothetical protein
LILYSKDCDFYWDVADNMEVTEPRVPVGYVEVIS